MACNVDWEVEKYREEHESEEQWELRKMFIERWKEEYDEERLICLARVFANIEFMGCRYPLEVMKEVSRLSSEVAKSYRESKKKKLQRTFVSASDAAEDRAKGIKRQGGVVLDNPPAKIPNINFIPQGHVKDEYEQNNTTKNDVHKKSEKMIVISDSEEEKTEGKHENPVLDFRTLVNEYLNEMLKLKCLSINQFSEDMFHTSFGKIILLIRPWMTKLANISASCSVCGLAQNGLYDNGCFTLKINNILLARATGSSKSEAKSIVETMAWNRLREECVIVIVKEQYISQGNTITTEDVSMNADNSGASGFGTPIESSVAAKMMKLMGWSGGGLGADSQGIAEPIKPQLQMVRRAGLGSSLTNTQQLRRAATALMKRYRTSDCLDVDLVFSTDFSKEERAELHQVAKNCGLQSRSYGKDNDRFLVVKKKLNPFSLVRAVIEKGGNTPKYQVFLPRSLQNVAR